MLASEGLVSSEARNECGSIDGNLEDGHEMYACLFM